MAYVWTICGAGAVLFLVMLAATLHGPSLEVEGWRILLVAGLALGADRSLLEIRFGANNESFTWAEVCVVLGLFLVPLPVLIVLNTTGVLLYHVLKRTHPLKATFNATAFGLGTALAGLVFLALPSSHDEPTLGTGLALGLGAIVFSLWNGAAVTGAVSLAGRTSFAEVYRKGLLLRGLVCLGNSIVGVGVVLMVQWSRPTVLVLPPLLLLMYTAYRGYLHAMQERDVWQQLESAARELNQLDEAAVAEAAVVRAAQMLKADAVQISIDEDDAAARSYIGDADGLSGRGMTEDLADDLMLYVAPLEGPRGRIGVLRIGFHGSCAASKALASACRRISVYRRAFCRVVLTAWANVLRTCCSRLVSDTDP
jgi:hypothetical protein